LSSRTDVSEALAPLGLDAYALDAALRKALKLSERWLAMPPVELKSLVQEIVDRITFAGELTRGSIGTIPASEETTNTQRFEADSLAGGPGFEPELMESESRGEFLFATPQARHRAPARIPV